MRYFDQPDTAAKFVDVKAIKRGTVTTAFGNFHFDPNGKDPLSRERSIRAEAALICKQRGYVKIVGEGAEDEAEAIAAANADRSVNAAAARRREASVEDEHDGLKQVFGSGGADTRDTTAFERDPTLYVRTGTLQVERADGVIDGMVTADDIEGNDDDDQDDGDDSLLGGEGPTGSAGAAAQEGNAAGSDTPPRDDHPRDDAATSQGGTADQSGAGVGNSETGNQASQQAQETQRQGGGVADAPAPKRTRKPRVDSAES